MRRCNKQTELDFTDRSLAPPPRQSSVTCPVVVVAGWNFLRPQFLIALEPYEMSPGLLLLLLLLQRWNGTTKLSRDAVIFSRSRTQTRAGLGRIALRKL